MSCPEFEERIAQYVGGDLAPEGVPPVEQHLRSCAACTELARRVDEDRARLATRPPETGDIDYAALRRRIRREIVHRERTRRWLPALVAAAAILLAVTVFTHRRAPRTMAVTPPGLESSAQAMAQSAPSPVSMPAPAPTVRRTRFRRAARPAPPQPALTLEDAVRMFQELNAAPPPPVAGSDSPVEIRIATNNPDVTIILLQETKGDSL